MLGSHVTTIAYPLLVLRLTGSPFTAGCVAFAATAPSIFAYMPACALVDRWDPRRAMLLSESGRGVAIATVVVTLALGKFVVPVLIAAAIIEGVLEVFSGLAERRYFGSLVGRDQVSSALVRIEARTHVVLVMGRPLGGLLFWIEPIFPFLADATTFVYSVVTLIKIKDSQSISEATASRHRLTPEESLKTDIKKGVRWIHEDKFARMTIISFSIGTLIFQALIIIFLGDAHARQLPTPAIGLVLAASGVGGALGSVAASRLLAKVSYPWIRIQTLIWFLGFSLLALPTGRLFPFVAIIMAVLGFTGALGNIALDTHLMQNVDKEMLARVTSVSRLVSFAACAFGPVLGGVLAQELGARRAMVFLFFITPVLLLISAVTPPASRRQDNSQTRQEESASGSSDLGEIGDTGAVPPAVEHRRGDSPGDGVVLLAEDDRQRPVVGGSWLACHSPVAAHLCRGRERPVAIWSPLGYEHHAGWD